MTDDEFQIVLIKSAQYSVLKEAVRGKLTCQPSRKIVADVEKIKKDIRREVEEEFRKKADHPHRKLELTFENTRFYFHIIKT